MVMIENIDLMNPYQVGVLAKKLIQRLLIAESFLSRYEFVYSSRS